MQAGVPTPAGRVQTRVFFSILIVATSLLIATFTFYQYSSYDSMMTPYYRQLVFSDSGDRGQAFRIFQSQYYDVTVCRRLPDGRPTHRVDSVGHRNLTSGNSGTDPDSSAADRKPPRDRTPSSGLFIHSVALTLAITTNDLAERRDIGEENATEGMPFFHSLLPSFCRTASPFYEYHIFLAYDFDDLYLTRDGFLARFGQLALATIRSSCPAQSGYTLHYIRCPYSQHVTWAQNDAAIEAYLAGIEYIYRVNDDTEMTASGWTETFISVLRHLRPPNVGICGPRHNRGNRHVLTYEFTHRSHIDIFGCYYSRFLRNWDGDVWITTVYRPERSFQIRHIELVHTLEAGTRYKVTSHSSGELRNFTEKSKAFIQSYILAKSTNIVPDSWKVISLSINLTNPRQLWGAVRNAQLRKMYFPDWTMRVYVTCDAPDASTAGIGPESYVMFPVRVLRTLRSLGAEIHAVGPDVAARLPISVWSYLAADDPDVRYLLIRHPETRLQPRDYDVISDWIRNGAQRSDGEGNDHVVCTLSQSANSSTSLTPGSWAIEVSRLKSLLGRDIKDTLLSFQEHANSGTAFERSFLDRILWPKLFDKTACCGGAAADPVSRDPSTSDHCCSNATLQRYDEHEVQLGVTEGVASEQTRDILHTVMKYFGL